MHSAPVFGKQCPQGLQTSLLTFGSRLFDSVSVIRPLQLTGSCSVFLCSSESTLCVVKSYQKHKLEDAELLQVHQEVELHRQLDADCVVPFWAAVDEGPQLHIVLQYCLQRDLRSSLQASGPFSETRVRDQVVIPLLQALSELHAKGYVHRDVKPDNVFMSADSSALLGDFSLAIGPLPGSPARRRYSRCSSDSTSSLTPSSSTSLADSGTPPSSADSDSELGVSLRSSRSSSAMLSSSSSFTAGSCCHAGGTPAYCAPEVVLAAFNSTPMAEALGPQNDVWSLGIVVAECLMGSHPYGDDVAASGAVMHSIVSSQPLPISQLAVSAHCKDWLAAALARDPRQRWSAERLLQHAWITEACPAGPQHSPAAGTAATAAAGGFSKAPAGHADSWDECCWHSHAKQEQQQKPHVGPVPPPWVEDDWVTGLDRLSSQLSKAKGGSDSALVSQRRQQEQQQQQHRALPQQYQASGITSWED